jgi:alkaline phosphatase D
MRSTVISRALVIVAILAVINSCKTRPEVFKADFENVNDRIWVGEDFWAIPMEDWRVRDGRIEGFGNIRGKVNILTRTIKQGQGSFHVSASMGLMEERGNHSAAGFEIGIYDEEDPDVRAACYFGRGINAGISTEGLIYLGNNSSQLPENFDLKEFDIKLSAEHHEDRTHIVLIVEDNKKISGKVILEHDKDLRGLAALVNQHRFKDSYNDGPSFWFDNVEIGGSKTEAKKENSFGPILWTMYTLSNDVLKLSAQMPPLGKGDSDVVHLQFKEGRKWKVKATEKIDPMARIAIFKVSGWDSDHNIPFRVVYETRDKKNNIKSQYFEGLVRAEPRNKTLVMGGLTCQHGYGFPYTPLVENLIKEDPDILYFSGDQIYEGNGGYPIKREPVDTSILSYLGKYYMFGWAFGDLMKNRPTVVTPDDHDVFQGNLWGEGGEKMIGTRTGSSIGYIQSPEFVNVVHMTQCGHLPDPFDPSPMKRDMSVWYTAMNYGGVSFAIISDRIFKSGPSRVAFWDDREDLIRIPIKNPSVLEKPDLTMLSRRQKEFLEHWSEDWKGVYMKVLLSQTPYANIATHHGGNKEFLYGDLDSGGWPKIKKDSVVRIIRKAFAFHINGDQHVTTLAQYGVDDYRDAGWSFCTPAIAVGFQRWFLPDMLQIPVKNRPDHSHANTGDYEDIFGNKSLVYAVGNPGENPLPYMGSKRYNLAHDKASGFGIIRFNPSDRSITMEAYRFLFDENNQGKNQFPGFPLTISQFDNYGREPYAYLPTLKISGPEDPVVRITNENSGEMEYMVRIKGHSFTPKVFSNDDFTIEIGYPEVDQWKKYNGVKPLKESEKKEINVVMNKLAS